MPDLSLEQEHSGLVAGLDEAGRGPFAGPLIAAAVILPMDANLPEITDSKKINKKKHREYADLVLSQALSVGIGVASVEYINRFGVGMANRHALEEAVKNLTIEPSHLLIDGASQQVILSDIPQTQVVKGDSKSLSIASASIVAKSIHDEIMRQLGQEYPQYHWCDNAGYGTESHMRSIREHGICKHHRTFIKPIKEYLKSVGKVASGY